MIIKNNRQSRTVHFFVFLIVVAYVIKKSCIEKLDFCVVHPDMAVYIRIVPILEKTADCTY